jgi:hypothetical protein
MTGMIKLELQDQFQRQVVVELLVRRDTVEIRVTDGERDRVVGIGDRTYLRDWLREPEGVYAYDELYWSRAANGVMLAIDDVVPAWPLADHVLAEIRELV